MIRLKFIGTDGSMRLCHGKSYNITIKTDGRYIWVIIPRFEYSHMVFHNWKCPYSSPQAFANNWSI